MIIFMHIPKTAGMTLVWALQDHVPKADTLQCISLEERQRISRMLDEEKCCIELIHGHIRYGFHHHFPQKAQYVTMLRHPIRRMISMYHHLARHGKEPFTVTPLAGFIEALRDRREIDRFLPYMQDNLQVRYLAAPHQGDVKVETLVRAEDHLTGPDMTFGITEQFDISLAWFEKALDLSPLSYVTRNKAPTHPEIAPDVWTALHEYNHFDMQLYDFALERFAQICTEHTLAEKAPGLLAQVRLIARRVRRKLR